MQAEGASFKAQTNALLRKSLTYQKRSWGTNCCLLSAPICFCILLAILQAAINQILDTTSDLQVEKLPLHTPTAHTHLCIH